MLEMLRALEVASGTTIAYEIAERRTGAMNYTGACMHLGELCLQAILQQHTQTPHWRLRNWNGLQNWGWNESVKTPGAGKLQTPRDMAKT